MDGYLESMWRAARATGASTETADVACRAVWLRLAAAVGDGQPPDGVPLEEWLDRSVVAECHRFERTRSWSRVGTAPTGATS